MTSPVESPQTPAPKTQGSPVPAYIGAFVVAALVIGLAFIIKDNSTKWIVVVVGVLMFLAVLVSFGIEMAGQRRQP